MDASFWVKLVLSVVVGSIWVVAITTSAERLGEKTGGLLGGLPSTVLVSYFFIAWIQGGQVAYESTTVFPLTYSIGVLCALFYVAFPLVSFGARVLAYVTFWVCLQLLLVYLDFYHYGVALFLWALLLVVVIVYVKVFGAKIYLANNSKARPSIKLWLRFLIGGVIIGSTVVMSQLGGPIVGGIFASFPGIVLSTLVIADRYVGYSFGRALIMPMMLSGMINCVVYVAVFRVAVLPLGFVLATFIAILSMLVSAYTVRYLISVLGAPKSS